ncbi:MAG TPA: tetratricopeptide repeat protein [Terricaulis sp.]|nr:tetratricopeptide repeat protein [Terricaulis sp.]
MTNETDTFVQEVDEKMREERMVTMAKRWGPWVGGAVLVFFVGLGGWLWWSENRIAQARAHADEYVAAQALAREGNLEGAKAAFAGLRDKGPAVYRAMARMEHAAILTEEGDLEAALAEFDAAADEASDPTMRDTARMRAAYIAAEIEDFASVQQRLQPLIDSESSFSFMARELLGIEAWEAGQTDLARSTLEGLSLALDAPQTVQERARIALSVIGPVEAPAAPATTPAPAEGESK